MTKQLSTHAQAAKQIRQELKKAFPAIEFNVRSRIYSGGSSVHIEWLDGPICEHVNKITRKYQYGSFDEMRDSYEISNIRKDIPQVQYVQIRRDYSKGLLDSAFKKLQEIDTDFKGLSSLHESSTILLDKFGRWTAYEYICRLFSDKDLTNGLEKITQLA